MSECYRCEDNNKKMSVITYKVSGTNTGGNRTKRGEEYSICLGCISPDSRNSKLKKLPRYENCILNGILRYIPRGIEVTLNKREDDNTRYDALLQFQAKIKSKNVRTTIIIEVDEREHFKVEKQKADRKREEKYKTMYANPHIVRVGVPDTKVLDSENAKTACKILNLKVFNANCEIIGEHVRKVIAGEKVSNHVFLNMSDSKGLKEFDPVKYMQIKDPGYGVIEVAYNAASALGGLVKSMGNMVLGSTTCEAIVKSTGKKCTNARKTGNYCGVHAK